MEISRGSVRDEEISTVSEKVFSEKYTFYLSYKINITKSPAEDYIFYMDALTGNVLRVFNQVNMAR